MSGLGRRIGPRHSRQSAEERELLEEYGDARNRARVPCPGGCGRNVLSWLDTDGRGHVVETAEPCVHCRPSRIIVVPRGHRALVCEGCDEVFFRPKQRGMPPKLCPECR